MHDFARAFLPNQSISKGTERGLAFATALFLVAWWYVWPPPFVPSPRAVGRAMVDLWLNQGLAREFVTSLMLYGEALLWATGLSFSIAYLTRVKALKPIVKFFTTWRFMGLTGLVFYFMIVTSDGHQLKLAILVFSISTFLLTSMVSIVQNIPDAQFDYARTLRLGELRIIWHVVIRGTLDQALNALRENAAIGWMQLAAVEALSRSEGGIGMLLWNQQKHLKLEHILAILLLFLVFGLLVNEALQRIKDAACPHAALKTAGGR